MTTAVRSAGHRAPPTSSARPSWCGSAWRGWWLRPGAAGCGCGTPRPRSSAIPPNAPTGCRRGPAAVYLYSHGRTQLLWLDFDAKRYGAAAVEADMATAASWLTQCGGVIVTDRSTSGGGHLICPLAIGTSASLDEMVQLVRLLAARLRTLDITPNTNAETGCMTPPGSPCREGGLPPTRRHPRRRGGGIHHPIDTRSAAAALHAARRSQYQPPAAHGGHRRAGADVETYTDGDGDDQRLAAPYIRDDPLPPDVAEYATRGVLSSSRPTWQSNHEAPHVRGHPGRRPRPQPRPACATMITPAGPGTTASAAPTSATTTAPTKHLARDFTKALDWLVTNVLKSSPPRHKRKYSPGGQQGPRGPQQLRDWLANAMAWADQEFAGQAVPVDGACGAADDRFLRSGGRRATIRHAGW